MRNECRNKRLDFEELSRLLVNLGFTEEMVRGFPMEECRRLHKGAATSMIGITPPLAPIPANAPTRSLSLIGAGNVEDSPTPLYGRLWHVGIGEEQRLMFMAYHEDAVDNPIRLPKREVERVMIQRVIYTELNINGRRTRCYVQHDRMTNTLFHAKADDISQNLPTDINGMKIDGNKHSALRHGLPVEIMVDGKTYTLGIDLQSRCGFSLILGSREAWHKTMNDKWGDWDGGHWAFTGKGWAFNTKMNK